MLNSTETLYHEIDKVDAHIHQNVRRTTLLEEAEHEGFRLISINTEVPDFPETDLQREIAVHCQNEHPNPGVLDFMATFSVENWGKTGWQEGAISQIENGLNNGAVAVKIWKNIGMDLRDENGAFIMADHPSFDPVYQFLEENNIPLAAHLGEPKNCWLPVDEMTVTSDKTYFSEHPEYHMYLQKDYPSYEEQLRARDHVLAKHPGLSFIGLHLASLEWSVERLAEWLDKHPSAGVDLAERVCHLQHQAAGQHQKVKEFMEACQDRIIYGTDQIDDGVLPSEDIRTAIRQKWHNEFRFFAGNEVQSVWNVKQKFRGLGLSEKILRKLFHDNAIRYYPGIDKF